MGAGKTAEVRRANYHYMADAMRMLEWDLHSTVLSRMRIPEEWHEIARERGRCEKTRVTLRLDADVVKFFRAMGPDWQARRSTLMGGEQDRPLDGEILGPIPPETRRQIRAIEQRAARRLAELARVDGLGPDGDYRITPATSPKGDPE